MPRKIQLSKTSQSKLDKFYDSIPNITEDFKKKLNKIVLLDVKRIKECSEASIVDFYIKVVKDNLSTVEDIYNKEWVDKIKLVTRQKLVNKYISSKTFDNNIDIYFNEVKREYILHPQGESEDLEFCDENRDIFIKNNLKNAISFAKRYQNLGLDFEDLIQVANIGLLKAFDKYDKERAKLKQKILDDIQNSSNEEFTYDDVYKLLLKNFTYTKKLDKTISNVPKEGFSSKEDFLEWADENIQKATFTSVTGFWIRSEIIQELDKLGKIIYVPKKNVKKSEETGDDYYDFENGTYDDQPAVTIVQLDSINPYTDDNYMDGMLNENTSTNELLYDNDELLEENERKQMFKDVLEYAFNKLDGQNRRIIKKRFGIDYPFPLSIAEISESEGINQNKIKYIIKQSLNIIKNNISKEDQKSLLEVLK